MSKYQAHLSELEPRQQAIAIRPREQNNIINILECHMQNETLLKLYSTVFTAVILLPTRGFWFNGHVCFR